MKRISRYVNFVADGDYTVMFNLCNSSFVVLNNELGDYVDSIKEDVGILQMRHPDLFAQMLEKQFVVDSEIDEVARIVEEWKRADTDHSRFSIIINPTLGCNLRCWYCYEDHENKPLMKKEVLDSIFKLIDSRTKLEELRDFDISFFGGEPLIGFERVVKPILKYASRKCKDKNIKLTSHFTTNGVLLTENVLVFLANVGLTTPASFQISLDGNRERHDMSRIGANKAPTYDIILSNIEKAAERGMLVNVRLNYTGENVTSFLDVLDDFLEMPHLPKEYVKFNFQQIWQDKVQNSIDTIIEKIKEQYSSEGFSVTTDNICHRHLCYADRENSIVVNYDGNIFKCTAREFRPEQREGKLHANGNLKFNELYKRRMQAKYSNEVCLSCRILPICNGGCSQKKIEYGGACHCIRNMSEEAKEQYIVKRLMEVIDDNKRELMAEQHF